jgi:acetyl-CoA C-acetyltransferase
MGCVLQAGQGQAPARQAALQAGLPLSAGCATIHKVCGSAMKATMLGHDGILAGSYGRRRRRHGVDDQRPYLLAKARGGYRLGHGQMFDHMFMDGLEDAYSKETAAA